MFKQADAVDISEGLLAYQRYHEVMKAIADKYNFPIEKVIAVFVSTSPNNDYLGNLRSTVSILDGINKHLLPAEITISTYKHCRDRAYEYATGVRDFLKGNQRPKDL
jgi:hypothetical protein